VLAHAQKPDFVFRRNGRVHLNQWGGGCQSNRLLAAEVCASAVVMVVTLNKPFSDEVYRVLATHSIRQLPPSLPLSCVTVCHHISTGLYQVFYQAKSGHDVKLNDYVHLLIMLGMSDALPLCFSICLHNLHRIGHPANCNLRCSSPQLITKSSPRSQ